MCPLNVTFNVFSVDGINVGGVWAIANSDTKQNESMMPEQMRPPVT